ncbi:MAG: hypothetical protein D8M57_10860 [Candidatus Scalindua sp. AMX11]|nr:MAG: hypothetical protein DWQ00_16195 [Candidatus Scalindua sp.]TDE64819.1 MAG: hypothetical protein D8M57_10860 [Candidatus Scalindua sp. AMX11]
MICPPGLPAIRTGENNESFFPGPSVLTNWTSVCIDGQTWPSIDRYSKSGQQDQVMGTLKVLHSEGLFISIAKRVWNGHLLSCE